MTRANAGCSAAPNGSSMISRSENRLTRNGSTDSRSSGPRRLKSTTAVGIAGELFIVVMRASDGAREGGAAGVRRQVGVERHTDVAGEQPSARRDHQAVGVDGDETVGRRPARCGE